MYTSTNMWKFLKVAVIVCLCMPSVLADSLRRSDSIYSPSSRYTRQRATLIPDDRLAALSGVDLASDETNEIPDIHHDSDMEPIITSRQSVINNPPTPLGTIFSMFLTLLGLANPAPTASTTANTNTANAPLTLAQFQQFVAQLTPQPPAAPSSQIAFVPVQTHVPVPQIQTAQPTAAPTPVTTPSPPLPGNLPASLPAGLPANTPASLPANTPANLPAVTRLMYDLLALQPVNQVTQAFPPTTRRFSQNDLYANMLSGLYGGETPSELLQNMQHALYQRMPLRARYPAISGIRQQSAGYNIDPQHAYINGGIPTRYYTPQYEPQSLYDRVNMNHAGLLREDQLALLQQGLQTSTTPAPATTSTTTTTAPTPPRNSWWLSFPFANQTLPWSGSNSETNGNNNNNSSSGSSSSSDSHTGVPVSGNRWQLVLQGPGRNVVGKSLSNSRGRPLRGVSNMFALRKLEHGTSRIGSSRSLDLGEDFAVPALEKSVVAETHGTPTIDSGRSLDLEGNFAVPALEESGITETHGTPRIDSGRSLDAEEDVAAPSLGESHSAQTHGTPRIDAGRSMGAEGNFAVPSQEKSEVAEMQSAVPEQY